MVAPWWLLVVCATALSAGMGWVSWNTVTPVYQSSAKVLITTPGGATTWDAFYGQLTAMSSLRSYLQIVHSTEVTSRTIKQLGLTETPDELSGRIVVPPSRTATQDIQVTGSDPAQTREIAQAVSTNLIGVSRELAKASGTEFVRVDNAGPAERVGSMWQPISQGAALGFVISVVLVLAYSLIRDSVVTRGQFGRIVSEMDKDLTR